MGKQKLLLLRRWLLQNLVPEGYWPRQLKVDGAIIRIRHTPYTFGTRWLITKGLYEKEERELLLQVLQPGMQVIEMGGSVGVLSAVISAAIGPTGRLVSIEASEKLTRFSKGWLEGLGNTKVLTGYAFPVWQAPAIQVKGFDEAAGSLGGTLSFETASGKPGNTPDSQVFDVKKICQTYGLSPDVLAVDVEGSEMIMGQQAISLPPAIQYLLIELHPGIYKNGRADEALIQRAIENDGFTLIKRLADVCLYSR